MDRIFIDANIWLDFYDGRLSKYQELLKSLKSIRARLFIPQQIVDEIDRNKASVYLKSIEAKSASTRFDGAMPPLSDELLEWNKKLTALKDEHKVLQAERKEIVRSHFEQICNGADGISQSFAEIFLDVWEADEDQLERAEYRKKIGNPPGKTGDPLGDQICWEQIVDLIESDDRLWLVSNDNDYFVPFENALFLNPLLKKDLQDVVDDEVRGEPTVFCFSDLPTAVKHFRENMIPDPDFDFPSDEELGEIEEEYQATKAEDESIEGFNPLLWSRGYWRLGPKVARNRSQTFSDRPPLALCSECGASMEGVPWYAHPSPIGRTYQARCPSCGAWIDSQETLD